MHSNVWICSDDDDDVSDLNNTKRRNCSLDFNILQKVYALLFNFATWKAKKNKNKGKQIEIETLNK